MRRPLVVLLAANAVSISGNVLTMLAVPWFVLQSTGSPARTGAAAFMSTLPIVISATFAGTSVDRVGLRRASVVCDVASGLIVAAIPALFLTTGLSYGLLLVLVFVRWLLATPGDTARDAMLPDLARRGHVPMERATAARDGVYRGANMVGAPLAGVLIVWLGPTNLLFLDAATFLASAVLIRCATPRVTHHRESLESGRYLGRLREGMAFLWRDRLLRSAVAMILVTNMLDTGMDQVLLPGYARDVAHDPRAFGLLIGAVGAGAVAGTITYGAIGTRLPRRLTFGVCFIAGVPRVVVLTLGAPFGLVLAVTVMSGFAVGAINPLLGIMQYERIPTGLRARVLGTITAGAYAGMPLGGLLAGTLTEITGLTPALLVFATVYLLASAPPLASRVWRQFDVRPHDDADLMTGF